MVVSASHLTVNVRVDWCVTDPDIAFTVTVYVPAGVPEDGGGGVVPPPHPSPARTVASTSIRHAGAILFLRDPPSTRPAVSKKALRRARLNRPPLECGICAAKVRPVVVIVRVLFAADPFGVTEAGLKVQPAPAGSPEQLRVTAALKPCWGLIARVMFAVWPAVIVAEFVARFT